MTWRERTHPRVSKAETILFLALQQRGLTNGMTSDRGIVLEATYPDFYWPTKGLAIYLDGPSHQRENQRLKDERIDENLRKKGIKVLRFSYKPPLTKQRLAEILDQIEEAFGR